MILNNKFLAENWWTFPFFAFHLVFSLWFTWSVDVCFDLPDSTRNRDQKQFHLWKKNGRYGSTRDLSTMQRQLWKTNTATNLNDRCFRFVKYATLQLKLDLGSTRNICGLLNNTLPKTITTTCTIPIEKDSFQTKELPYQSNLVKCKIYFIY